MDLAAHLLRHLEPIPDGSLVPAEWVRELIAEAGGASEVDLTVEEVGTLLDRAPSTIRTWAGAGKLPGAYRLQGREWRIPRASLRALRDEGASRRAGAEKPADLSAWRKVRR